MACDFFRKRFSFIKQFVQFNIVGLMNTAVDFVVFTLLNGVLSMPYMSAKTVSYSCGILNSYIVNTAWTFKRERKRTAREISLFALINLLSLGASLLVMYVCKNIIMIKSDMLSNVIAIPVSLTINFAGNKLFVFRDRRK